MRLPPSLLAVLTIAVCLPRFVFAASSMNVVLVTADDLGLQLGSYGDAHARTPHLDRFAAEGTRFTRAYVTQSSCSPSRSSLLTGLYPHQNGQIGLANRGYAMREAYSSIPGLLREAGFFTGIIGKLHVAPASAFPFDFERTDNHDTTTRKLSSMRSLVGDFLDRARDQPFFLMVNYFDPHLPWVAQVEGLPEAPRAGEDVEPWGFQGGLDDPRQRARIASYYDGIERMDALFGDLLAQLGRRGLGERTVVIFISDNGPPFARAKMAELDASVHVPLIIRWPGLGRPGIGSEALVSGVDIFHTALDAAGAASPTGRPGCSLRAVMDGAVPADWRETVATEFTSHQPSAFYPRRSVTDGRYRLVRNLLGGQPNPMPGADGDRAPKSSEESRYDASVVRMIFQRHQAPPPVELYDLRSDPHCLYNLASEATYSDTRARLESALSAWMEETDDPLRTPAGLERYRLLHELNGSKNWEQSLP